VHVLFFDAGCEGIAWNVTAGLFDVFGARFVLNIWFPRQNSNRYLLLPNGTTADSTAAAATVAALQKQQQNAPNGSNIEILPLEQIEGILLLSYRRFFSSINARDDYSFLETPLAPTTRNDSSGKPIVRRQRGANVQLPAYWGGRLAWGSPPIAKEVGYDWLSVAGWLVGMFAVAYALACRRRRSYGVKCGMCINQRR
jgi:hypothetical protein